MENKKRGPVALDAWESLANEYAERIEAAPYNAYIERPAMLSLLPDVKGKHVLDAGCGSGFYSEILLNRGAIVTAIDVSPKMIQHAQQRLGKRARIRLADLENPLDSLPPVSDHGCKMDYFRDRKYWPDIKGRTYLRGYLGNAPGTEYMTHRV